MVTMNELLESFYLYDSDLYDAIYFCSHNYNDENLNPWHLEGSVLNHTILVMKEAEKFKDEKLLYAALLHDIGKVFTRKVNDEKKRVSFYGHENFSIQTAVDFMRWMGHDKQFIETVCKLISLHMKAHKVETKDELYILAYKDQELAELLKKFSKCDGDGRISKIKIEQKV